MFGKGIATKYQSPLLLLHILVNAYPKVPGIHQVKILFRGLLLALEQDIKGWQSTMMHISHTITDVYPPDCTSDLDYNTRQEPCQQGLVAFSPDVGEHEEQRANDDGLQDLPVPAQVCHPGHQQLPPQHHETGHHGHRETPPRQTQLNPWGGGGGGQWKKNIKRQKRTKGREG